MANAEKLLEDIGNMTVLELAEFVEAFKTKFNVTAVVAAAAPAGGAGGGAAAAPVEEQTEFDVILKAAGEKKIQVIKVVREVTSLGLQGALQKHSYPRAPIAPGIAVLIRLLSGSC